MRIHRQENLNRIICPACEQEKKRYNLQVAPGWTVSASWRDEASTRLVMPIQKYNDAGKEHKHDINERTKYYKCSNGHMVKVVGYEPCPSCAFNAGRSVVTVEQ